MIFLSKVKKFINKLVYENEEQGQVLKRDIIYPYGLISKPKKGEEGITIGIGRNNLVKYFIPIIKNEDEELGDKDIMVTDGNNKLHFNFEDKKIRIKSDEVIFDVPKVTFENSEVEFKGNKDIKHNDKIIDSNHSHTYKQTKKELINPTILPGMPPTLPFHDLGEKDSKITGVD